MVGLGGRRRIVCMGGEKMVNEWPFLAGFGSAQPARNGQRGLSGAETRISAMLMSCPRAGGALECLIQHLTQCRMRMHRER
jgi:hypothetical protein